MHTRHITHSCLGEWDQRLRPSGARSSASNSITSSVGGRWGMRRQQRDMRHDSLYDPLLVGMASAQQQGQQGQQHPHPPQDAREELEQEERAAVFRNSLFAEAGEKEWACAVCAFDNR